jgi:hypothetical protein
VLGAPVTLESEYNDIEPELRLNDTLQTKLI